MSSGSYGTNDAVLMISYKSWIADTLAQGSGEKLFLWVLLDSPLASMHLNTTAMTLLVLPNSVVGYWHIVCVISRPGDWQISSLVMY